MYLCPIRCLAHSRCSINISRISSETEAVTREAVLSITGSASPLKVLPPLLASSLSVRRKVWNKHYQRRRGETQEQRGRSGQEEKDNPWRRMFFEQHFSRHPPSLSGGSVSALNEPGNDTPVRDEPGPRILWQPELKLVVLWTSLGVFNNLLVVSNNKHDNDSY